MFRLTNTNQHRCTARALLSNCNITNTINPNSRCIQFQHLISQQDHNTLQLKYNHTQKLLDDTKTKYIKQIEIYQNTIHQLQQQNIENVNKYQTLFNEYISNNNVWNNKYNMLQNQCAQQRDQVQSLLTSKENTIQELEQKWQLVSSHNISIEKELKQLRKTQELLTPQTNDSPTIKNKPSFWHKNKSLRIIQTILFHQKDYYYRYEDLLSLFDDVLKSVGLFEYKVKDCLLTIQAINHCIKQMGTNSNAKHLTLQQFQCIIGSAMNIVGGELVNKDLFHKILPSKKWENRNNMIKSCVERRVKFDQMLSNIICDDYSNKTKKSRMSNVGFFVYFNYLI